MSIREGLSRLGRRSDSSFPQALKQEKVAQGKLDLFGCGKVSD
jgi:hypothetical protein